MWMKKNEEKAKNEDEMVSAIVMPLLGHSDNEVTEFLNRLKVEVDPLASGYLSVKTTRRILKNVEAIARVELKPLKQMH